MRKIVLTGYYGYNNVGDDALLLSIVRQLREVCPEIEIVALTRNPVEDAPRFGVSTAPRLPLREAMRSVATADLLLLGGGSLLQDATSFRSLAYYYALVRSASKAGVKVVGYAQGVGPLRRPISRLLARSAVRRCEAFIARDAATYSLLRSWRLSQQRIFLGADPVFDWPSPDHGPVSARRADLIAGAEFLMGISLREPLSEPSESALIDALASLPPGWKAVFVPMSPEDAEISGRLAAGLSLQAIVTPVTSDLDTITSTLAACDGILAMRLHAGILGAVVGKPLALLEYDPKVAALGQALGVPTLGTSPISSTEASSALLCLVGMRGRPAAEQVAGTEEMRRRCGVAPEVVRKLMRADSRL